MADTPSGFDAPEQPPGAETNKDARTMAMLAHLLAIFLGFLGPLIIWLIKKDEQPFVDDQGKEALNFQITMLFAFLAAILLTIVTCGFGFPLILVVYVVDIVFSILGAVAANQGQRYRYPICLRLIK